MFSSVERKAKQAARSAALLSAGGLCLTVGAGFLTVGAWIFLVSVSDNLTAAIAIGAIYSGLGLVLIGVASSKGDSNGTITGQHQHQSDPQSPPLVQAFLHGMQAGADAKRR